MQQYKEIPEQNKLIVYIPKCPYCKRDMVKDTLKGYAAKSSDIGSGRVKPNIVAPDYLTISPVLTWTNVTFICKKHPQIYSRFSNELLDVINKYPHNRVVITSYDNSNNY